MNAYEPRFEIPDDENIIPNKSPHQVAYEVIQYVRRDDPISRRQLAEMLLLRIAVGCGIDIVVMPEEKGDRIRHLRDILRHELEYGAEDDQG
jgi:hypothetical protein